MCVPHATTNPPPPQTHTTHKTVSLSYTRLARLEDLGGSSLLALGLLDLARQSLEQLFGGLALRVQKARSAEWQWGCVQGDVSSART